MFFPLSFYIISSLVNFITCTSLALFILFKSHNLKTNRMFSYFSFSVGAWNLFYFLWLSTDSKPMAEFYMRTLMLFSFFNPTLLLHFTYYFLKLEKSFRPLLCANYLLTIFFIFTVYTPHYANNIGPFLVFPYWLNPGPIFHLTILQFVSIVSYCLYLMWHHYTKEEGTFKNQIYLVFIGLCITVIGGSTNYLCWYRIAPPFLTVLVSVYVIMTSYAITRYQLMDIRFVIRRSLVYTVLISVITMVFFILIYLTEKVFQNIFGYTSLTLSLISATTLTALFIPLKDWTQKFIDNYFFKGSYIQIAEENERLRQDMAEKEKFKAVATLASGMAHEIRNPLQAIKTFSEYLPGKLDDKEFLLKFSRIANDEVNRIDRLIQQMLNFSRPSTPLKEKTDMAGLINDTLMFLDSKFIAGRVRVVKDFCAEPPALEADPNQIRQALMNIFLNAIDAMPDGGTLNIAIHPLDHYLLIRIADTGKGIAATDLPHIFDPFFTRKDHGTGLGLAVTKGIIHEHGGEISVESRLGQGTTFTLRLPLPS